MKNESIVSISTPLGKGAISIVRMSGDKSFEIALKVFYCQNLDKKNVKPRYMYFGKLKVDEVFEECLFVYFKSPFSYTGEDLVEFQIHGGVLIAQKVMEVLQNNGARLAEAGEFSKRAFVNGKITLDKAEAIIGEINAETEGELKSSLQITNGKLAQKILEEQDELKLLLAEIEVGMDYPDEAEEEGIKNNVYDRVKKLKDENFKILEQSKNARYLKDGINVVLVGRTNVGKSSIMNALLGQDRAIVTDVKGTTRDSITESFVTKGIKINLIDTAGIRQTDDLVENIGIEKSKQSVEKADVVLFVMDATENFGEEDEEIYQLVQSKNLISVINKTDKKRILEKQPNEIEISALENKNIEELKNKIVDLVIKEEINFNSLILTNERHVQILQDAQSIIDHIINDKTLPIDVISMLLKKLWQTLGKITGNTENEDIIDLIFSKFCLGK